MVEYWEIFKMEFVQYSIRLLQDISNSVITDKHTKKTISGDFQTINTKSQNFNFADILYATPPLPVDGYRIQDVGVESIFADSQSIRP